MTKPGFGKLASLQEARKVIFSLIQETADETILLEDALHRVVAGDVVSEIDVPHFRKAAMDGFAVIAEDTFGASNTNPKQLEILDSITAGMVSKKELGKGCCIEITTGAALPRNATAEVMVEHTEREGKALTLYKSAAPGENVISIGSDIKKGSIVLKKGTMLTPPIIGVLSAIGTTKVVVKKRPVIAYFSTGNEIVAPGEQLQEGKIYDINSATITQAIRANHCELVNLGVIKDDLEEIKSAVLQAVEKADLVLLSGGSSLGGEDFMVQAVAEIGEVLIHGIAVKPGKPVLIGKVKGKSVIGLPGYPTSALSNFYILIVPVIGQMLGFAEEKNIVQKRLSRKISSTIGRYEFLAVRVEGDYAVPVMKGSSAITTLSESDGFLGIDENTEVLEKDSVVEVILL
ncbi:MAG: gephyrin-like molybdotransferase Glp [Nanoarchaeota archaeon]